jgi:hypothetical protein
MAGKKHSSFGKQCSAVVISSMIAKIGVGSASIFDPMISIFIGLPSSCTLLYLLTAARASDLLEKTTSAVPC